MFTAFCNRNRSKNEQECAEKVRAIPIIHLYGHLGLLPWQDKENGITYEGKFPDQDSFMKAISGIKIIHDDLDIKSDDQFLRARNIISNTNNVLFIGFGYDKTNIERLIPPQKDHRGMWGTAYDMTSAEKSKVVATFKDLNIKINLRDAKETAYGFIRNMGCFHG